MSIRIEEQLRQLAEQAPVVRLPSDLYDRARRRHRRRLASGAAALLAVGAGVALLDGPDGLHPSIAITGSGPAGTVAERVGGPVGWLGLVAILAILGFGWRRRSRAVWWRRMLMAAAVGIVLVLSAPPGTALWGEPHRTVGLPDRLATPRKWTWAAEFRQSPPGAVAMIFSGPATHANLEEGRVAMVAADGDRYRVWDTFNDPFASQFEAWGSFPGDDPIIREFAKLSPDGRYLASFDGLLDLNTGEAGPSLPGEPVAWSADGKRVVCAVFGVDDGKLTALTIWDIDRAISVGEVSFDDLEHPGTLALSHDGTQLAVDRGDDVAVFRFGDGEPYRSLPVAEGWRLGGPTAWSPDGEHLAIVRDSCRNCPGGEVPRQVQVMSVQSGAVMSEFASLPTGFRLQVQGWRSPEAVVVQVDNAIEIFTIGRAAPTRLMDLPQGVANVEIATDLLTRPLVAAGPATYGPPNIFFWMVLGLFAVPLSVVVAIGWLIVRFVRWRWAERARPTAG